MDYLRIDKTITEPIYKQIASSIEEAISDGRLKYNTLLPTEKELCNMFDLSPTVAKMAYESLIQKKLVKRIKGKGTFVTDRLLYNMQMHEFYQVEQFASKHLKPYKNKLILLDITAKEIVVNRILKLESNEEVFVMIRLIEVADNPVILQKIFLPINKFADIKQRFDVDTSIYHVIEDLYMYEIGQIHNTFSAINASSEIAKLLSINTDDAVYYVRSIYHDKEDQILAYVVDYLPGEHSELEVNVYGK